MGVIGVKYSKKYSPDAHIAEILSRVLKVTPAMHLSTTVDRAGPSKHGVPQAPTLETLIADGRRHLAERYLHNLMHM